MGHFFSPFVISTIRASAVLSCAFIAFLNPTIGHSDTGSIVPVTTTQDTTQSRARLRPLAAVIAPSDIQHEPVLLRGGTKITLVSPQRWAPLANRLGQSVESVHQYFTELLGTIPPFTTTLRLMDDETFFLLTGAPRWTNAMFYKSQIMIPLPLKGLPDFDNLDRALRHEYTHAIIHALSAGRCPGWLDEGLAQWAEGAENPALLPALKDWLGRHDPVPLKLLQGGFTRLDSRMVPAAYAQSLFAASTVINTFGFKPIRNYLETLRDGSSKSEAFADSFQIPEHAFEARLNTTLLRWHQEN